MYTNQLICSLLLQYTIFPGVSTGYRIQKAAATIKIPVPVPISPCLSPTGVWMNLPYINF